MASVELRFQPTIADVAWAGRANLRCRPKVYYSAIALFVVLPIMLAALALARAAVHGHDVDIPQIAALIGIPACMFGGAWVAPYLLFRNSPLLRDEQVHRYDADGMVFHGRMFDNRLQWSGISRAHWVDGGLLLLNGSLLLVALPARILTDETRVVLQGLLQHVGVAVAGVPAKRASA